VLSAGLKSNNGDKYINTPIIRVNTAPTNIHNKPDTLLVLRFSVAPLGFLASMDLVLPTESNYHQIMAGSHLYSYYMLESYYILEKNYMLDGADNPNKLRPLANTWRTALDKRKRACINSISSELGVSPEVKLTGKMRLLSYQP